jgi:hypothetical protein
MRVTICTIAVSLALLTACGKLPNRPKGIQGKVLQTTSSMIFGTSFNEVILEIEGKERAFGITSAQMPTFTSLTSKCIQSTSSINIDEYTEISCDAILKSKISK